MSRKFQSILGFTLGALLVCGAGFAQRRAGGGHAYSSRAAAPAYGHVGSYGGYGYGYGFGYYPTYAGAYTPTPEYWGGSPYPSENPCQAGCNPNAGYEWDSVGTLILDTNPPQAKVTLDGVYAGTTDKLGPFQLPVGQHTLHIEAAGFEPSDIIVKFDQPGTQSLNVELKRLTASAKPAPKP